MQFEDNCASGSWLKLKPWRVILKDKDHGWSPLLWVVYLGFFFIQPVAAHEGLKLWLLDLGGAAVFLVLYFGLFAIESPKVYLHLGGMMLLGLVFQPINNGACTFFIFAAAMLPFCVQTNKAAVIGLLSIGGIAAIEGLLLRLDRWTLFFST